MAQQSDHGECLGVPILSRTVRRGYFLNLVDFNLNRSYDKSMAKTKKFDLEDPAPILDEEDEETLAAIDEGIRDAEAGRVVPAAKVRELLPTWITSSSTRKKR